MRDVVRLLLRPVSVLSLGLSTMGMMAQEPRDAVFFRTAQRGVAFAFRNILICLISCGLWSAPAAAAPSVEQTSTSVTEVTTESAVLHAVIDPGGVDTPYYFQYASGMLAGEGPSVGKGDAGEGITAVTVGALLQGLAPDTTYRFRVVAGGIDGEEASFTTQSAAGGFTLPDNRMWEMVSPPDKSGARIEALPGGGSAVQASAGGDGIAYVSYGPVGEVQGNRTSEFTQVLSTRSAQGWSSQSLTTPSEEVTHLEAGEADEYKLFSSDLSLGLLEPKGDTPLPPLKQGAERTIYVRNDASGEYTPLVTAENVVAGATFGRAEGESLVFLDGTPDLSHVIFSSSEKLTPEALPATLQLYEWEEGTIHLLSVSPEANAVEGRLGYNSTIVRHAMSDDGERVVWQEGEGRQTTLNLRDMSRDENVRVDTTQAGALGGEEGGARFQTASNDGSRVFFTDDAELTTSSHAGEANPDLYVFEAPRGRPLSAGKLTDLTVPLHVGESAGVQGAVLGTSEEGTYVYFVANGVLAPGPTEPGHCVQDGSVSDPTATCYLYVAHYDVAAEKWEAPRFITTLATADEASWDSKGWPVTLQGLTSEVSPDGSHVAFMSDRILTGYDTRDASSGAFDQEVYVYDAEDAKLVCASCNPTGARPHGVFDKENPNPPPLYDSDEPGNWVNQWVAASIPGWTPDGLNADFTHYQPRYLSNEGRLFFDSSDSLVPADTNATEDVYEYEPNGIGDCESTSGGASVVVKPAHAYEVEGVKGEEGAGCVGLISSGTSRQESVLMDSSVSGDDVFFLTAASLVPEDKDSAFDVYDAHVCSSASPCVSPQAPPEPPCETTLSCRAPSSGTPAFAAPPTAGLSGAGNLTPPAPATVKTKTKPLTRAQKLAAALKACRKKPKKKRATCERQVRKTYGASKTKKARNDREARS